MKVLLLRISVTMLLGALLSGCGPELERVSELRGLRVLAVQKDTPYAAPETDVEFRMLWEDTAEDTPRETERFWIGGCDNPPGDQYAGCFVQWATRFARGDGQEGSGLFGEGDRFVTQSPPIRAVQHDPQQPPYGIGYVFFGVCAGQVDWEGWFARVQTGAIRDLGSAFPFCLDPETREPLGSRDYVVGYSAVYSYAEARFRNENPVIGLGADPEAGEVGAAFQVGGVDVAYDCIGQECVCDPETEDETCRTPFLMPELTGCIPGVACIDSCADDGEPSCPGLQIRPLLDQARNAEPDTVAREVFGRQTEESMWISYFVDRGSVRSDLRLLNDGVAGWNDDYASELYAPREPGPLRIWAVVRDNRGGVNWIRVPAYVR